MRLFMVAFFALSLGLIFMSLPILGIRRKHRKSIASSLAEAKRLLSDENAKNVLDQSSASIMVLVEEVPCPIWSQWDEKILSFNAERLVKSTALEFLEREIAGRKARLADLDGMAKRFVRDCREVMKLPMNIDAVLARFREAKSLVLSSLPELERCAAVIESALSREGITGPRRDSLVAAKLILRDVRMRGGEGRVNWLSALSLLVKARNLLDKAHWESLLAARHRYQPYAGTYISVPVTPPAPSNEREI